MKIEEIKYRLNRYHPSTVEAVLVECGFTLTYLAHGQFRTVFKIGGHPLVLKVPFPDVETNDYHRDHANAEHKMYMKVMRSKEKYAFLKPYMPEVLFHSNATGVTLVEQCKPLEWVPRRFKQAIKDIDAFMVQHKLGIECGLGPGNLSIDSDLTLDKYDNFGVARDGTLKILDLGCAEPVKKHEQA